jgi:hypothetical protein
MVMQWPWTPQKRSKRGKTALVKQKVSNGTS